MSMMESSRSRPTSSSHRDEPDPILQAPEEETSRTQIREYLVSMLTRVFDESAFFPRFLDTASGRIITADIAADVHDFKVQREILRSEEIPSYAVALRGARAQWTGTDEQSKVIVKVPDLARPLESYRYFLDDLDRSGLSVAGVSPDAADEIFTDRLSDFILARVRSAASGPAHLTEVHTRRRGDTVIYAKGYFLSTGTAMGTSTPATATLPAGQYSFGIFDSGSARYEGIVWDVPATSTITVNLP